VLKKKGDHLRSIFQGQGEKGWKGKKNEKKKKQKFVATFRVEPCLMTIQKGKTQERRQIEKVGGIKKSRGRYVTSIPENIEKKVDSSPCS